ncbi:MAG: hypothetical protein HN833_00445 [Elusimicrobiaceae bacterium]|jgi:hypothetical protein|nr:hypothetical protein [Elusimicrobiaceae bacterium]MBT3955589.1 hypothetical protein [Elusimicrobiaceae bacterium]MBT4008648.1 hypothetical protein [Elusimicrobiaceae bacterium]MBT4402744.1 hypothetical protein [Elusimicrobiaceae bacterium]MBT4439621.1 hypothetical protein [Elusimicrobiaceae bacterium]
MRFLLIIFALVLVIGCASTSQKEQDFSTKKVYLEEDLISPKKATLTDDEKRKVGPQDESEYIFDVYSDKEVNVYKFDEYNQPIVPGVPQEKEYKKPVKEDGKVVANRLWEKPARTKP